MITSGHQIKAARALIGWRRLDLAKAAKLHPNAVAYWERARSIPGQSKEPYGCEQIRMALQFAGVETFAEPAPGVRLIA